MRIVAGNEKGRRVGSRRPFSQRGGDDELRPTPAKVREALFDILRDRVPGASFLDLYAGTGAVGIEALSRGAGHVVFVEVNPLRVKIIRQLLTEFGFVERATVVQANAYDYLKRNAFSGGKYDIIFLDPPYSSEELMKVLP